MYLILAIIYFTKVTVRLRCWVSKPNWRDALGLQERAPYSGIFWYRATTRVTQLGCTKRLFGLFDRLADPSDKSASHTLTRVLESWRPSERRSAREDMPELLESRIQIMREAALMLGNL
ncbi:MAG: hypothetical protein QOJ51_4028 [Acidobacteriaceae bacterium]|nr:hypothetical protein [Acidobacteriaceae bacterium]